MFRFRCGLGREEVRSESYQAGMRRVSRDGRSATRACTRAQASQTHRDCRRIRFFLGRRRCVSCRSRSRNNRMSKIKENRGNVAFFEVCARTREGEMWRLPDRKPVSWRRTPWFSIGGEPLIPSLDDEQLGFQEEGCRRRVVVRRDRRRRVSWGCCRRQERY